MKKILFLLISIVFELGLMAQDNLRIDTLHEEQMSLKKYDGYAAGLTPGYLLILGGQLESVDDESYLNLELNDKILLKNWLTEEIISAPLSIYPESIRVALSSVKMQYYQDENTLYIIGGYGYWHDCNCQTTIPSLLVMDVDKTIEALKNAQNPSPYIRQLVDDRLSVMDGFLEKGADTFFLLEGRKAYRLEAKEDEVFFFVSEFNNQVRSFKIMDDGQSLNLVEFETWTDLEAFFDKFADKLIGTYLANGEYKFKMDHYY